jgi:hypothetical protein
VHPRSSRKRKFKSTRATRKATNWKEITNVDQKCVDDRNVDGQERMGSHEWCVDADESVSELDEQHPEQVQEKVLGWSSAELEAR